MFNGEDVAGIAPDRAGAARHGPHLPEPAGLHQHERDRQRDGRRATCSLASRPVRRACCDRRRCAAPMRECRDDARCELMQFVGVGAVRDCRCRARCRTARSSGSRSRARWRPRRRLLLLDEPAAGLNQTETGEIEDADPRIAAAGTTVVLVEHDMKLVMGVSRPHPGARLTASCCARRHRRPRCRPHPDVIAAYLGAAPPRHGQPTARGRAACTSQLRPHPGAARRRPRRAQGELVALVGANGAGKTTLLRAHLGRAAGQRRRDPVRRRATSRASGRDARVAARHLPGARGPPGLRPDDGGGQPAARRLRAPRARKSRGDLERDVRAVPGAAEKRRAGRRHALGRPAADAGDRPVR